MRAKPGQHKQLSTRRKKEIEHVRDRNSDPQPIDNPLTDFSTVYYETIS